jgi:hypothetical protein
MPWLYLAGENDYNTPLAVLSDDEAIEKVGATSAEANVIRQAASGAWFYSNRGKVMMKLSSEKEIPVSW